MPTLNSRPLHTRVLVRMHPVGAEERTTESGLIVVAHNDSPSYSPVRFATVLAVGDGEVLPNGDLRPLYVDIGDVVRVHENEVLPFDTVPDYSQDFVGLVDERQILTVEE